uniref:Uncharacterized protein n=1 Tax=Lepeophtheirus salmonis TaxID=72036 RepID=A0A0K2T6V8_LEPSM
MSFFIYFSLSSLVTADYS